MKKILLFTASCLLSIFLWWHYRLGMTRYFDVDEFAHLSWAYQMLSGRRPYIDFLFFFPPGFHVFLMPLFAFGSGITPIIAGRVFAFIVFVLLVGAVTLLFWIMRKTPAPGGAGQGWVAIFAGMILTFLPMPFDKFLEIRPDTLATLFAMVGLILQIKNKPASAGVMYGLSLLVLPKVLPQIMVAAAVAIATRSTRKLLIGMGAPLALFGLWALTLGNLHQVMYSLTRLPVEANKISETFIMMPDLFFYPNATFYGNPGWGTELVINHIIWIIAIFTAAYRLITSPPSWSEFLVVSTFFIHVLFYVQIVPLKHTQYLIPIAVFVAFYAADAVNMLWEAAGKKTITIIMVIIIITVIEIGLYRVFLLVNTPKLAWSNADTIRNLTSLYRTIPKNEYVLDLTGETIYYRHPYVACCTPFGQSAPYVSRPLPDLTERLEKTQTKYVFEGEGKRTSTLLPQDQSYITTHYLPHPSISGLLVRK